MKNLKLNSRLKILSIVLLVVYFTAYSSAEEIKKHQHQFGMVIHGGAGTITKKNMTPEKERAIRAKLEEALARGYKILKTGGTSLDAVEESIKILENSPLFNAGKGAVFTSEETHELDASIMCGKTLQSGATAGVKHIKNPITLARKILEKSPHVLLMGDGAETFAKEMGIRFVDQKYFFTEIRYKSLKRIKKRDSKKNPPIGTVGAVALDKHGNLAAGTSTGGMTNKKFGRVGDSPIIGAGTYANNSTCAISSTGHGEFFIRAVVAYDISALIEYKGFSLKEAADIVVMKKLKKMGGSGGIIGIDKNGNMAMVFNTKGMYRGCVKNDGRIVTKIYSD